MAMSRVGRYEFYTQSNRSQLSLVVSWLSTILERRHIFFGPSSLTENNFKNKSSSNHRKYTTREKESNMDDVFTSSDTTTRNKKDTIFCIVGAVFAVMVAIIAIAIQIRNDCKREATLQQIEEEEKKRSCPHRRKRAISKLIETKKVISDGSDESQQSTCSGISEEGNECPICLDTFKKDQSFSQARGGQCKHIFHEYCLTPWLLKHDDCPCCRKKIIDESTLLEDDIMIGKEHVTGILDGDGNV